MAIKALSKCIVLALLLTMAGCNREDEQAIIVQQVPKQPGPQTRPTTRSGEIIFTDPPGWTMDGPMQFRYASYHLGDGEDMSEIIVAETPAKAGEESRTMNINRWRGQVKLPPLKEGEAQPSQEIMVGGEMGALFDFTGPEKRQIAAWVPKGQKFWFIKISGPIKVVEEQQNMFMDFLKSVQFASEKP